MTALADLCDTAGRRVYKMWTDRVCEGGNVPSGTVSLFLSRQSGGVSSGLSALLGEAVSNVA